MLKYSGIDAVVTVSFPSKNSIQSCAGDKKKILYVFLCTHSLLHALLLFLPHLLASHTLHSIFPHHTQTSSYTYLVSHLSCIFEPTFPISTSKLFRTTSLLPLGHSTTHILCCLRHNTFFIYPSLAPLSILCHMHF